MNRPFECKNCGYIFVPEYQTDVVCPKCKSDNVDYKGRNIGRKVGITMLLLTILLIISFIWWEYVKLGSDSPSQNISYELAMESVSYDESAKTYDCRFSILPHNKNVHFVIYDAFDNIIATSANGDFESIQPCNDDAYYLVCAKDASTDSTLCMLETTEFKVKVLVDKPWTAQELEERINRGEDFAKCQYLAPKIEIKILNKHPKNTEILDGIAQIVNSVVLRDMQSVHVLEVLYNEKNQISKLKIELNYPADWYDDFSDEEW